MTYLKALTATALLAVPAGAAFLATGPAASAPVAPASAVHAPAQPSPAAASPPDSATLAGTPAATGTGRTRGEPAQVAPAAGGLAVDDGRTEAGPAPGGLAVEDGRVETEREPRVLGTFSDRGRPPEGFDVPDGSVLVDRGSTTGPVVGADDLSGGPWCNVQCITEGVAYLHGSGVEIVVETSVQAQILVTVVRDVDGDDIPDLIGSANTPGLDTQLHLVLDDLEPGATYYGMATATDAYGNTSYAWGHFTMP